MYCVLRGRDAFFEKGEIYYAESINQQCLQKWKYR